MATAAQEAETALINRISMARGSSEPQPEPTESPEVVDVSGSEIPEEAEVEDEAGLLAEPEAEAEPEELASTEADTDPVEDKPVEFVELNGREITLSQIEEWEQGSLRQADYTRKTQVLADDRKLFEAEKDRFNSQRTELDSSLASVNAILSEETLTQEQLEEMRELDPEDYIKYIEKIGRRTSAVNRAKNLKTSNVDFASEDKQLMAARPEWVKDGKMTEQFNKDKEMIRTFALANGYTEARLSKMNTASDILGLHARAVLSKSNAKNAVHAKRVRIAPVTTKPGAPPKVDIQSRLDKAKARLKETGQPEDAVKVRQLKRQLQTG